MIALGCFSLTSVDVAEEKQRHLKRLSPKVLTLARNVWTSPLVIRLVAAFQELYQLKTNTMESAKVQFHTV